MGGNSAASDNLSARDAPGAENREPRAAGLRQRFQGDIDIRIATDGTWLYAGTPIERIELVKLFATMLKRDEGGDFWLETPEEKARIAVDDAPFTIVAMNWTEDEEGKTAVTLRTNLDEEVALDEKASALDGGSTGIGRSPPLCRHRERIECLDHAIRVP